MRKKQERDKKGRYVKGHKGGPGRPRGEPRDIICKDGKKRSVEDLITDLLAAYRTLGGQKFLKKWAAASNKNLAKFIEILFKFAPHPEGQSGPGDVTLKIISAVPRPDDSDKAKRIRELEDQLKERDEELHGFRASVDVQDVKEIEHEPVRPDQLPEHVKEPKAMSDEELDQEIKEIEKELKK